MIVHFSFSQHIDGSDIFATRHLFGPNAHSMGYSV